MRLGNCRKVSDGNTKCSELPRSIRWRPTAAFVKTRFVRRRAQFGSCPECPFRLLPNRNQVSFLRPRRKRAKIGLAGRLLPQDSPRHFEEGCGWLPVLQRVAWALRSQLVRSVVLRGGATG